ncbi:hypothetical protein [Micromonospora sp. CB01531]|uniref:hypothetical protein n=1 Tax=Micromonospora sp. CB01531 TaxID=1718947 RepID=UPI000A884D2F|nr:hypothetical protein [Micromonospora sp. CB01531]
MSQATTQAKRTREEWLAYHISRAPMPTWERWERANAALGVKVWRRPQATPSP